MNFSDQQLRVLPEIIMVAFLVVFYRKIYPKLDLKVSGGLIVWWLILAVFSILYWFILPKNSTFNQSPLETNYVLKKLFGYMALLSSFASFFLTFRVLSPITSKLSPKHKCPICGKTAKDILSDSGTHELGTFCRVHLIQKYSELFPRSTFHKVMVEFQPKAARSLGAVYGYYPVSEIIHFGWEEKDRQTVENLTNLVADKKCKSCENPATTLFVSEEAAPWSKYNASPSLDFANKGEYLCNEHALKRVLPSIQNNPDNFDDGGGLCLPYKEVGFQIGTEL